MIGQYIIQACKLKIMHTTIKKIVCGTSRNALMKSLQIIQFKTSIQTQLLKNLSQICL